MTPDVDPAPTRLDDVALDRKSVPGYVDFLAADGRAVWATNTERVEKLTLESPDPVATIPVPGPCGAMVVHEGSLWVASCADQSLYRLDVATGAVVAVVATGLADPTGELSLAAGAGSVWVLSAEGALCRVDAAENRVTATIPVLENSYCAAFLDDSVWITNSGDGGAGATHSVQRIDAAAEAVVATVGVGPQPRFLAAGEGAIWTLNWGDGSVSRVDPGTNREGARIALGMEGLGGDIATGAGRVWVRGTSVLLATIDPATNAVDTVFGPPEGSGAVRVAQDLVWVTAHDTNTVWVLPASPAASGGAAG